MTKDEIQRRLASAEKQMIGLQDEIQNLKAKLNEVQDVEIPKIPKIENGMEYWFMTDRLEPRRTLNKPINADFNMFHTETEAKLFSEKCKLIAMMLHCKHYLDDNGKTSFGGAQNNYTVWYNHYSDEWQLDWNVLYEGTTVYFSTKEAAQKAADWLNARMEGEKNGEE